MPSHEPRVALKSSALLGETPVWSAGEQRLYWIDSIAATIHRFDPASGRDETLAVPLVGYLGLDHRGSAGHEPWAFRRTPDRRGVDHSGAHDISRFVAVASVALSGMTNAKRGP